MGSGQGYFADQAVSLPLVVREAAEEDIREAFEWYETQSPVPPGASKETGINGMECGFR